MTIPSLCDAVPQPVVDHYSTYALDGATGDLRWKHEPGDFEVDPAYYLVCMYVRVRMVVGVASRSLWMCALSRH